MELVNHDACTAPIGEWTYGVSQDLVGFAAQVERMSNSTWSWLKKYRSVPDLLEFLLCLWRGVLVGVVLHGRNIRGQKCSEEGATDLHGGFTVALFKGNVVCVD